MSLAFSSSHRHTHPVEVIDDKEEFESAAKHLLPWKGYRSSFITAISVLFQMRPKTENQQQQQGIRMYTRRQRRLSCCFSTRRLLVHDRLKKTGHEASSLCSSPLQPLLRRQLQLRKKNLDEEVDMTNREIHELAVGDNRLTRPSFRRKDLKKKSP